MESPTTGYDYKDLKYQFLKVSFEKYNKKLNQLTEEERNEVYRIANRKIHIEKAVLASAESSKVIISTSHLNDSISEIKERYEDTAVFQSDLEDIGIGENEFTQAVGRELQVEAILDYVGSNCDDVSDSDASLFYYMHPKKFVRPETRIARHILVTINEDNPENTSEKSLHKIQQILKRVTDKPKRFEEQALKHSECPTSLEGGLLGEVKKGVLFPDLDTCLFSMKAGEISDVLESEIGFHILRCDEIMTSHTPTLTEVLPKLKDHLSQRNRKIKQRQWLDSVLKQNEAEDEIVNGDANDNT